MPLFLERIDAAPIMNVDFDPQLAQWISVLVDRLNEDLEDIQDAFNLLSGSVFTSTQINELAAANLIPNGVVMYDATNNVYVGRQNGALVKFTTSAYP